MSSDRPSRMINEVCLRLHALCCPQYCCNRLDIPRTPADVPGQRRSYLLLGRMEVILQKSVGSHDETGRAISTLRGSLLGKCFLDGMQFSFLCQAFDSEQVRAVSLGR